jgi:hypothetical protein
MRTGLHERLQPREQRRDWCCTTVSAKVRLRGAHEAPDTEGMEATEIFTTEAAEKAERN